METPTDSATGPIIKSDRSGRTRYTAQYKREVLDAFEVSSLSALAFTSTSRCASSTSRPPVAGPITARWRNPTVG